MPRIRSRPEDFAVEEIPLYEPAGRGDTTLVQIRKRGVDTEEVARRWARCLGLDPGRIGFAGRKDRLAVCRQWLSLPGWRPEVAPSLASEGVEILAVARHDDRLRPGDLLGNRFSLRVREVAADPERVEAALADIAARGLVNRYGTQRFGRDGSNPELGRRLLGGERVGGSRRQRRFLIAAFQAELFHACLDRREVAVGAVQDGDLLWLHGSGTVRPVADREGDAELVATLEASPSGPVYGAKMRRARGRTGRLEDAVWAETGLPSWDRMRVPRFLIPAGGRRPLRVPVADLEWEIGVGEVDLRFTLPAGSYATVLVSQAFGAVEEGPA
ncbi:MAG: tRNA pseudouridine(13) synthase TruD [Thermoanaerobaculia bacterium]|nr:tRNA pseudouridine(13) synthase TruD [Thermoanaerobaculia bacterium]